jgi:hypothetical protein
MISNQRKYYSKRIFAITFLVLALSLISFVYLGTELIPAQMNSETSYNCTQHLKNKSYQIKQVLLENANNSKLWIENRQNTFFDSKWFAISYYEHDEKEWVLKDFTLSRVALDIYKIAQSEYIKVDQALPAPSASSQQMTLQESQVEDTPLLVLDIPNSMSKTINHLIRVTLFMDPFLLTLNSDEKCKLILMDSKGNFLTEVSLPDENEFLKILQNEMRPSQSPEVSFVRYNGKDFFIYKVFKNLYMVGLSEPQSRMVASSVLQISIFNFIVLLFIILIGFTTLFKQVRLRLESVNANIQKIAQKDYQLQFDLSNQDELTDIEEELLRLIDETRKNKKS